jgi:teichuronic acid biosynthesis glycosyltransferase TuaC
VSNHDPNRPSRAPWGSLLKLQRLVPADRSVADVLFVTNLWPDEARPYYGTFIASQARSLVQAGAAVDVLYVQGYVGAKAYAKALVGIPLVARRKAYDIVHVHYGHTIAAALGVTARPLVASFCGEDLLGAPRASGDTLKSRVEVAAFRQAARAATVTITKSQEMERVLPEPVRRRNHVLPNGVDLERFRRSSRADARAQLGWDRDERVALFLGNPNDPRKNVELAHATAAELRRRGEAVRLHIGWEVVPDAVPLHLNAADCLLFPSRSEGSPNAVKEAMACELPIVATAVGDIPERFAGVEGCAIAEPAPAAFADAAQEALRAGRAPQARAAVRAFGLDRVADRLLDIYDRARHQAAVGAAT